MTIEELFVEEYKKLEKKYKDLEEEREEEIKVLKQVIEKLKIDKSNYETLVNILKNHKLEYEGTYVWIGGWHFSKEEIALFKSFDILKEKDDKDE